MSMRIATIIGTRPELIRLSLIINRLDEICEHTLIHTGQNYDPNLHDIFFNELGVRRPDYQLDTRSETAMGQVGEILKQTDEILRKVSPDRVLILGDTNSALTSIVAARLGIKVYHMEAGNRCFDNKVPEEINRRIVDHSSDVLLPYTERSRDNLRNEGIHPSRILVTGNPIYEVISHNRPNIKKSDILQVIGVSKHKYFLCTLHRTENVDNLERLKEFITALEKLNGQYGYPIILSLHPRTDSKLQSAGIDLSKMQGFVVRKPFGFFDFISLEESAYCVLSDSGTVQEECAILKVPSITLRDVTERPETLEAGSNILTGCNIESIMNAAALVTKRAPDWSVPQEYMKQNTTETVCRILLSHSN